MSEVGVLISLYLSYELYKAFIRPIVLMQGGADAILEEDFSVKFTPTASGDVNKLIHVYNSMIDRLRLERTSMEEQSHFVQKLINVSPLGIVILDYDNIVTEFNEKARTMLQVGENLIGSDIEDTPSRLLTRISELEVGTSEIITLDGITKFKCQVAEVIQKGFRRKFILMDNMSSELLATEKEAYGRIIRMMAHEVNNSMGAINSIIDSVLEFGLKLPEEMDLASSLEIAKERNTRLSAFMSNYAAVLRLPAPDLVKINISHLLKKSAQLYIPIAREHKIGMHMDVEAEATIFADETLLEQAFSNIFQNSIEAIGRGGNIQVKLQTSPFLIDIIDDGSGIKDDLKAKLFTPFFSTKETGQGVGLMIVREILASHNLQFRLRTDSITRLTHFEIF